MHKYEQEDIVKIATLPYSWEKLKNSTILLSGGTGLIGNFFCEVIKYRNNNFNNNIKVLSLTRRGGSSSDGVNNIKADVTKDINIDEKVDYVVHLASNTHPKVYEEDPVGTIMTNVKGCDNLLKIAVEKKVKKFIFASSDEAYGTGIDHKIKEEDLGYVPLNAYRSGYNESKRVGELLCQSYKKQYNQNVSIVRFTRVFGYSKRQDSKAMAQFIEKAVNQEDIILNSKGEQRFSYIYVADAVSALVKVMLDGENGEAYNAAAEDENKTLFDYASYLASLAGTKTVVQIKNSDAVSRAQYTILDTCKLKKLGWKPLYSITEGLNRTYTIKKETK